MDLKANDILLFVLILAVPVYLFMSTKGNGNILDQIKRLFGKINGKYPEPVLQNINDSAISSLHYKNVGGNPVVNIIRDKGSVTGENTTYYKPQYIPKDTMGQNDIGTTEYRFAQFNENKPSKAWVDYNISQNAGFYKSDFTSNIYDLKQFFDKENVFREVPDNRKYYDMKKPSCPSCYTDVNGATECDFNGKLETIPKSLYNVGPHGKTSLQKVLSSEVDTIGTDQYTAYNYAGDKPMNGSNFYGDVQGVIYGNTNQLRSSDYENNDTLKCI